MAKKVSEFKSTEGSRSLIFELMDDETALVSFEVEGVERRLLFTLDAAKMLELGFGIIGLYREVTKNDP